MKRKTNFYLLLLGLLALGACTAEDTLTTFEEKKQMLVEIRVKL